MVGMNEIALVLAALAGGGVLWLFWRGRLALWAYALMLVPALMLGHALARIGPEKLTVKPWLYFMQSGGLALAFVIPALVMLGLRGGAGKGEMVRDSAAFLLAYLAMGAVFYGLA